MRWVALGLVLFIVIPVLAEENSTVLERKNCLKSSEENNGAYETEYCREELQSLPSARDPWAILDQTPGVDMDRFNVGGTESGQQSGFRLAAETPPIPSGITMALIYRIWSREMHPPCTTILM